MAGDWMKIEHDTPDKPEVLEIARLLDMDQDAVVGKLVRVWIWFDRHSVDGSAPVTVRALLDRYAGRDGFVTAMVTVGWMEANGETLQIPHFEYHLGKGAKARAQNNRRQETFRKKHNANSNGGSVTKSVTREEKRREEKSIKTEDPPLPPVGGNGDGSVTLAAAIKMTGAAGKLNRLKVREITPDMVRVGSWFGHRETTKWSVANAKALHELGPLDPEELDLLEKWYTAPGRAERYCRKTLTTLLNNWTEEVDKARGFSNSLSQGTTVKDEVYARLKADDDYYHGRVTE